MERIVQFTVAVFVKGVEVGAQRAREENRVLRDDGQSAAEILEADLGDVDAIHHDAALLGL